MPYIFLRCLFSDNFLYPPLARCMLILMLARTQVDEVVRTQDIQGKVIFVTGAKGRDAISLTVAFSQHHWASLWVSRPTVTFGRITQIRFLACDEA